jgi:arabinan endo-1,5-alpha-L-arabinosidase
MGRYAVSLMAKNADGEIITKAKNIALNYSNPVLDRSAPDPTIIRHSDGMFYLYATEDTHNMPIFRSSDLVKWDFVGTVFTNETRPTFEPGGGLWAPDINYVNGQYVLYYSMSVWGGETTCGIGRAIAANPEGPFTDLGALFRSNTIDVVNSIDPFYIEDEGKKYLFWGSFHGIWGIELTDDGLNIKEGAVKRQIGGTAYEASYIHKRGNYYYLFASWGSCCEGLNSTYRVVVGRSQSLWGPYTNKSGKEMIANQHQLVISRNKYFAGTGHNSEIIQDDDGNDWILYHGYRMSDGKGRLLLMDKIVWDDNWPTVKDNGSSAIAESPVFDWK